MSPETELIRIQTYLQNVARSQYDWIEQDPFTLFFHPSNAFKYYNYAIPNQSCGAESAAQLPALRHEFEKHQRVARFEFFEAFAPGLPAVLRTNGFLEEGRQWSMLCTQDSYQKHYPGTGITLEQLSPRSNRSAAAGFLQTQQEAFSPEENHLFTEDEIDQALQSFTRRSAFLAWAEGQPVGAASYSRPIDGITEITGIATRPAFRRQGIATALTAFAVQTAFDQGVQTVCLTAEDERAGRVYQRVGFQPFSIMLAYIDQKGIL